VGAVAIDVLLAVGVASSLVSAAGLLLVRDPADQLHFTGPPTVVAPVAIAVAVLVEEPLSSAGVKALLVAVVMLLTGPVLVHATARAALVRERGRFVIHSREAEGRESRSRSSKRPR
jgi:multicomponent Na+:H+ antiporter subunit G